MSQGKDVVLDMRYHQKMQQLDSRSRARDFLGAYGHLLVIREKRTNHDEHCNPNYSSVKPGI
jgi:hypothetical protein